MRILEALGPHWANACALREQLQLARTQGLAAAPLAMGVFMLDARLRCRERNAAADAMLSEGWWSLGPDGLLDAGSPATRAAWREARQRAGGGRAPMFPLHDRGGRRVAIAALHALGSAGTAGGLPANVLLVRPLVALAAATTPDQERLRSLFQLTAAEAALALALHRTGDLAAAASELGIGERGARIRLQALFDKTDCRRQGELLRLMDAVADLGG